MEIYFKLIHPEVSKDLLTRTEKKLERIGKRIHEGRSEAQVYVEITKASGAQHSETAWQTIINLDVRGDRLHAEAVQGTPEKAADRAVQEMESEVRKLSARTRSVNRKANGFWKSLLQSDFTSPS